jgi:signal-transduction protein with cAMP-binding, CBS, and nucleotidyltransferase domain
MLSIVGYELCPAEMMASNPYGVNQKRVEGTIYYMDT